MTRWTPQDEIHLQAWVDAKGFKIVYVPSASQWGYTDKDKPHVINGGFKHLSELKQHLVNLKGEKKNVQVVSEGDFHKAVEDARRVQKLRRSL